MNLSPCSGVLLPQWADVLRPRWLPRRGGRGLQGAWDLPGSAVNPGYSARAQPWTKPQTPTPPAQSSHTDPKEASRRKRCQRGTVDVSVPWSWLKVARSAQLICACGLLTFYLSWLVTPVVPLSTHNVRTDVCVCFLKIPVSNWNWPYCFLTFCGEPSPAAHLVWKFLKDTEGTLFLAKGFLLEFEIALSLSSLLPAASSVPMLWPDAPETLRDCFPLASRWGHRKASVTHGVYSQ